MRGVPRGGEPIEVRLPCMAFAGKERRRRSWRHHLDGNDALGAVMELWRADQLHLAIAVQAVEVGIRQMRPIWRRGAGVAAQQGERGICEQPPPGLLGQLPLQSRPDALSWLEAATGWPLVAMLEPDHHAGGTDERDHIDAGDAVRVGLAGKQLEAQVDRPPGGPSGPEQDGIVEFVGHAFTVGDSEDRKQSQEPREN